MPHTTAARFATKVNPAGPVSLYRGAPGPCHQWTGATTTAGYGRYWHTGRAVRAHRHAYEQQHGPIPDGLDVDHLCRNRACVNPAHLRAVTHRENILASSNQVAARARVTACPAGHPYDTANTYRAPNGTRKCRTCKREQARARRAATREQQLAPVALIHPRTTTPERQAA